MAAALLIAISAAGAAEADIDFDALRRLLCDALIPAVSVAGQNMVRVIDLGLSLQMGAAYMGLPLASVNSLVEAGILKPLPLPGVTRLRKADIDAYVRKLTSLPMTDDLREEVWPSVEEYRGDATEPGILDGWTAGMRYTEARETAAARALEREFLETIAHLPQPKVTVDESGNEDLDMTGVPSDAQVDVLRQAFLTRKRAQDEAERYARLSRGY